MRRLLVPLLALVLTPAAAASFTYTVETRSPVTAPGITLSGDDQSTTFSIQTRVANTGFSDTSGWKVQASATTPTSGSHTLPAIEVTDGSYSCYSNCSVDPTPTGVAYPLTLSTTAQTIYNANRRTGEGTFNVTSTFQISYPASAILGTYTSTVTITAATGPT